MMTTKTGIPSGEPPQQLKSLKRDKSQLLFEARLLDEQGQYEAAADKFVRAAELDRQYAVWAESENLLDLALIHRISELSCWGQAGYPHRAIQLIDSLLASSRLDEHQVADLRHYRLALQQQFNRLMQSKPFAVAAD